MKWSLKDDISYAILNKFEQRCIQRRDDVSKVEGTRKQKNPIARYLTTSKWWEIPTSKVASDISRVLDDWKTQKYKKDKWMEMEHDRNTCPDQRVITNSPRKRCMRVNMEK